MFSMHAGLVFTDLQTNKIVHISIIEEVEKIERVVNYRDAGFFDYRFTLFDGREILVAENEISKYLYEQASH
ncbi:MAG: hypothetical protein ACREBC_32245 [Pyrinomonadaceae bacterium]